MFFLSDRAHRVLQTLQKGEPMVIGLQEAFYDQAILLADALGYKRHARGREEDVEDGETNAILWNGSKVELQKDGNVTFAGVTVPMPAMGTFWYSDHPDEPGSRTNNADWGNPKLERICTWARLKLKQTGREFYVYNTHLQNDGNATNGKRNRMKSVELLAKRIEQRKKANTPVIVMGDFNDQPTTKPIELMTESAVTFEQRSWTNAMPLVDTFAEQNPGMTTGTGCPAGSRIDYIFRSPGTMTMKAAIMIDPPGPGCQSDHFPVTAGISIVGN